MNIYGNSGNSFVSIFLIEPLIQAEKTDVLIAENFTATMFIRYTYNEMDATEIYAFDRLSQPDKLSNKIEFLQQEAVPGWNIPKFEVTERINRSLKIRRIHSSEKYRSNNGFIVEKFNQRFKVIPLLFSIKKGLSRITFNEILN